MFTAMTGGAAGTFASLALLGATGTRIAFASALKGDPRVTAHLDATAIDQLLDPASHTGLSARIARAAAERARDSPRPDRRSVASGGNELPPVLLHHADVAGHVDRHPAHVCFTIQSVIRAATSALFFSSIIAWPLPWMPASASRISSTKAPQDRR